MNIMEFVESVLGTGSANFEFIKYIVGSIMFLILVDGIVSLLFGTVSNTVRGGR